MPLARPVVALFRELQEVSGDGKFVFPSARAKTDTISDAGPLNALRDLGYPKEVMTLHGFRSMASTRLNEMGYRPDIIETQPAHKDPDAVCMVYNRAQYMDERRKMMEEWADYLDGLRLSFPDTLLHTATHAGRRGPCEGHLNGRVSRCKGRDSPVLLGLVGYSKTARKPATVYHHSFVHASPSPVSTHTGL